MGLGYGEPWEVFDTSGEGYATSYMFARGGFELLAGAGLGAAASAPGKLGKAALAWDAAGNANSVRRGGYGVWQDGELNFQDGAQIVGGGFGLAGNFGGLAKASGASGRIGSIVGNALPGTLTPLQRQAIIARVEALLAAKNVKVEIKWGALIKNQFNKDSKIIHLMGSATESSARGAFLEELQHLIDDVNRLTPDPIPKEGTLENAIFHEEVFERMTQNADLFEITEAECDALIEWISLVRFKLGGLK